MPAIPRRRFPIKTLLLDPTVRARFNEQAVRSARFFKDQTLLLAMIDSSSPLQLASLICCRDGSISDLYDAFVCPDLPGDDPTQTEVLEHLDAGIAVSSLVSAVLGIHQLLDGQDCGSDTIASIAAILQDQLGLEIRGPGEAAL